MSCTKKTLCLIINVDWFLVSHFYHYIKCLVDSGIDLKVITAATDKVDVIRDLGVKVYIVQFERGYSHPWREVKCFLKLFWTLIKISPDSIEAISVKAIVYGGLASIIFPRKRKTFYVSGLGYSFTSTSFISKLRSKIFEGLYRIIFNQKNSRIIVENKDDKNFVVNSCHVLSERVHLLPGAGVDLNVYFPKLHTDRGSDEGKIVITMVSRLLVDKGVLEFLNAANSITKNYRNVDFLLVGDVDLSNPMSLKADALFLYKNNPQIKMLGRRNDIAEILRESHIFVLPSYREGFPKALMEAAAVGLPSVTTSVPGCQDAVVNNSTGLLVEARSVDQLVESLTALIDDEKLRLRMGKSARCHAEKHFDVNVIAHQHLDIIGLA